MAQNAPATVVGRRRYLARTWAARPQPIRLDDAARQTLAELTSELRASEQRQSRELAERMMISLQETQDLRDQVLRHVEAEEQLRFGTSTVARGTGD